MEAFLDHWLRNILGLIIIGGIAFCGWVCYDIGYNAGRKAGIHTVHQQLMNPCCDSQARPCCKK